MKFFRWFILIIFVAAPICGLSQNGLIFKASFEGNVILETYVDETLTSGQSAEGGGITVTATESDATVQISNAIDLFNQNVTRLVVTGGPLEIQLGALLVPQDQAGSLASAAAVSCPDINDPSYPVTHCVGHWPTAFAAKADTPGDFELNNFRVPGDGTVLTESAADGLTRKYDFFTTDGSRLYSSDCSSWDTCDGKAVLLIHGFQYEPDGAIIQDNGGGDYWGAFPLRLIFDGYNPFEFQWMTNARFEDVALDLSKAIEQVAFETGKQVHIVAHSFGGILIRRLLQDATFASAAAHIGSVTTIGSPQSGIFRFITTYQSVKFPSGQDNVAFDFCNQISCHLAGENVFGSKLADLLGLDASPGEEALFLANSTSSLPPVDIQVLIGLMKSRNAAVTYVVMLGDGLIRGTGQRFHPSLAFDDVGNATWDPLLAGSTDFGEATVTEYVLGRASKDDPDLVNLIPDQPADPTDFVAFKHSKGTSIAFGEWNLNEPYVPFDSYHDVYQRVVDWIGPSVVIKPTYPLNDTGITWGGSYPSGNNADCTGETIAAQDCSLGRDVTHNDDSDGHAGFSFTKLDMNGNTLPASAADWSCVRDNVTGLVWEVKTDDGGLRDTDNTYTWYNPDPDTNGGSAGTANGGACVGSDCDTTSYVGAVNALPQALCGYRDWRMPWKEELRSIVDYGRYNPTIDTAHFPRERSSFVWSGSPYAGNSNYAWYVNFNDGSDHSYNRNSWRVRLVRGAQ